MKTSIRKLGIAALIALLAAALSLPYVATAAAGDLAGFVNVSRAGSSLKIEPTVVFEADAAEDIAAAVEATAKPSTVLFTVNDKMEAVFGAATQPVTEVLAALNGKCIPALRIEDAAAKDAFLKFMKANTATDIMVVSKNIDIIAAIYGDAACYAVNSVYDVTGSALPSNRYDFWDTIAKANAAGCNILLLNGADENVGEIATYCASLSKVCWASVADEKAAVSAIADGLYGVAGSDLTALKNALTAFKKDGFARAQFIAAHRGVTAYANENSLTALAAAANEGATHVEVDLQVTNDGSIILCHDSDAGASSTAEKQTYVSLKTLAELQAYTLNDYSELYEETFPTLQQVIETLIDTDVIFIFELKFDNGSDLAIDKLQAVQTMYSIISRYEKMRGRWMAITFFAPYAKQMREICPEIPLGFLDFGKADTTVAEEKEWSNRPKNATVKNVAGMIPFLRKHNLTLDMKLTGDTYGVVQQYLARGYVVNAWTYSDTGHFAGSANIATTDAAEACAMYVKSVCPDGTITITRAEAVAKKADKVQCVNYNGWTELLECELIVVDGDPAVDAEFTALLYYTQDGDTPYGIYSGLTTIRVS